MSDMPAIDKQFIAPSRPHNIGIVGLGNISSAHLTAYRQAGWPVVVGADVSAERRVWAEREHGLPRTVDSWEQVIADPSVEVVSLLTQPTLRETILEACIAAEKPLLVEKPLASDLPTAERMAERASTARLPTTVSQNYRWLAAEYVAGQLIAKGLVGKPFLATIQIYGTQDRDLCGDHFYSTTEDFLTVQWNTHLVDLIRTFTGSDPIRVSSSTRRSPNQHFVSDCFFTSLLDMGPGVSGHIVHSELTCSRARSDSFRIDGDEGTLIGGIWDGRLTLYQNDAEPVQIDTRDLPHAMCGPMGDLMYSIEAGVEPTVSFKRNLATLRTVYAEQTSARHNGEWVAVGP